MSGEAAARLGDEIAHGFGLAAMIAGAVVGAVVGVAIVAATAATGGLAAVIIAGCVAGGGLAMGQIAAGLKTIFNLPEPTSGILGMGSPNVLTNLRPAARAVLDFAAGCTGIPINHFPMPVPVPLAEGSSTVLINGMPASRLKSMLTCGAHMKSGSTDVVIGGPTVRMLPVFDLEGWFKTGLEILGMGAMIAGGLFAAAAGVAALGTYAAILGGGALVFEGLGQLGDALGPGYRDLFQGVAGMGLLLAGPRMARGVRPLQSMDEVGPLLRSTVANDLAAQRAAGASNNRLGPATSVVMDRRTGTVSSVFRNNPTGEVPANLHPTLAQRLGGARAIDYPKTAGAGSHSEVYAVNQLLNQGSKLSDIAVYTEQIGGRLGGTMKPACVQCSHLLDGVWYVGP